MDTVIHMSNWTDNYEICCICLEPTQSVYFIVLNCCKHKIHKHCLFILCIHKYINCPLCRQNIDPYAFFTEKECLSFYEQLSSDDQEFYRYNFDTFLYNLSQKHNKSILPKLYIIKRFVNLRFVRTCCLRIFQISFMSLIIIWFYIFLRMIPQNNNNWNNHNNWSPGLH